MNTKILIVEDDADIREGVRILLESEGYAISEACNGKSGLAKFDDSFSLVILDVMMPGISGLKTCEEIRKISVVPVLFLTAKSNESDKLIGLMAGGDDYLVKPFSYAELLGRVKALLRRYQVYSGKKENPAAAENSIIRIGNIAINENFNEATVDGKEIDLTDLEYRILLLLMKYPKKIFSAQNLYESIWQEDYLYSSNSTVMVHIRKIRAKIEKRPDAPDHIKTVWGKGYRFE
ncbi:response regulator transcription factor [Acidaminobacterium chupaoyuni]